MTASVEPRSRIHVPARAADVSSPASWRYPKSKAPRWGYAFAILASVCLHGMIVFGVNPRPQRAVPVSVEVENIIQMEMPEILPDETEERFEELSELDAPPAVAVPQLADVPSLVELSDFQQPLDLRPTTAVDLGALKQVTIPVNINRGGTAAGLGSVFNLADLDRRPEPISQPAPNFPFEAKREGVTNARVVVQFVVDADGRVHSPIVVSSSDSRFDQAAMIGVARWKFRPGMRGGRKVATRMEIPLLFETTDE